MTSIQSQNMLRLSAFLSCCQHRWPPFPNAFFFPSAAKIPPCPSPNCQHTYTIPLPTAPPIGCCIVGLRDGGVEWGDYESERLVKGLPWSFCCVTDGWEAEQACFAWEEKPAEGRKEVYSMRPVTQNHPLAHPTPSSSIPSSFRPSFSLVLPLHLGLPFFFHFVAFICPSSLLLSHPTICTPPPLSCPLYLLISSHLISVHSDFPFFPSSCFYVCEFHNICFLSSLCGYCEWEGIMEMSLSEPFITKRSHLTRCSDMLSPHLSQQEILWHN